MKNRRKFYAERRAVLTGNSWEQDGESAPVAPSAAETDAARFQRAFGKLGVNPLQAYRLSQQLIGTTVQPDNIAHVSIRGHEATIQLIGGRTLFIQL